ncbi:MAG: pimeloyl-ACP methyl ester esterase BioH [Methylophilaceae bacterium]|nr:pimeloyl-ACP methyl ester esterase BioH [Methylophilaceae bacterium]
MTLHVETRGQGADLVLIHGWGLHGGVWQPVVEALAQSFRVHVVDLPGLGKSPTVMPYTLPALAEKLASAFSGDVAVCGWSLGGQVAMRWALDRPEQVRRVVLVDTTPRFVSGADWQYGIEPGVFRQFAGEVATDYQCALSRFLALQVQGGEASKETLRQLRACVFRYSPPSPKVLQAGLALLLHTDLRKELAALATPALVVQGGHDRLVPTAAGHWLAEALPDARIEICETASHAPFLSHPRWFVGCVKEFLGG